ncbi:hypothetical protein BD311DRAFT_752543 [Dichomitus squalens]|uniref:REJ domain-containing protein n=1 Tax=Dichomitus squalens TaxID=114155 RepID=A0A4Q9MU58_9APHY|nr:hypothetical protein BD311DRAFT_752543 [Dichomitus squalens]
MWGCECRLRGCAWCWPGWKLCGGLGCACDGACNGFSLSPSGELSSAVLADPEAAGTPSGSSSATASPSYPYGSRSTLSRSSSSFLSLSSSSCMTPPSPSNFSRFPLSFSSRVTRPASSC